MVIKSLFNKGDKININHRGKNNPNYGNRGHLNPLYGKKQSIDHIRKRTKNLSGSGNGMYNKILAGCPYCKQKIRDKNGKCFTREQYQIEYQKHLKQSNYCLKKFQVYENLKKIKKELKSKGIEVGKYRKNTLKVFSKMDDIVDLYINKNFTIEKLAKKYNTSLLIIRKLLKVNNVKIRMKGDNYTNFKKHKDKIIYMYVNENKRLSDIKKEFHYSVTLIKRLIKENDVKLRKYTVTDEQRKYWKSEKCRKERSFRNKENNMIRYCHDYLNKNSPFKFMGIGFQYSKLEAKVCKIRFEKLGIIPIYTVNCHIYCKNRKTKGVNEFDFYQFGFLHESHPCFKSRVRHGKETPGDYKKRREEDIHNSIGKISLVHTQTSQEANKLYAWLSKKGIIESPTIVEEVKKWKNKK